MSNQTHGIINGDEDSLDDEMHTLVQIEWVRAKAHSEWWVEEVTLVHEEMHRTLAFLDYKQCWWEIKAIDGQRTASEQLQHGMKAYAHEQAGASRLSSRTYGSILEEVATTP